MAKGVDFQVRETFESAVLLSREAARQLGATDEEIDELIEEHRSRDRERLALQSVQGIYAGRDLLLGNTNRPAPAD